MGAYALANWGAPFCYALNNVNLPIHFQLLSIKRFQPNRIHAAALRVCNFTSPHLYTLSPCWLDNTLSSVMSLADMCQSSRMSSHLANVHSSHSHSLLSLHDETSSSHAHSSTSNSCTSSPSPRQTPESDSEDKMHTHGSLTRLVVAAEGSIPRSAPCSPSASISRLNLVTLTTGPRAKQPDDNPNALPCSIAISASSASSMAVHFKGVCIGSLHASEPPRARNVST